MSGNVHRGENLQHSCRLNIVYPFDLKILTPEDRLEILSDLNFISPEGNSQIGDRVALSYHVPVWCFDFEVCSVQTEKDEGMERTDRVPVSSGNDQFQQS